MMERTLERANDRELHIHSTTEIRGATVLPSWFTVLLIISLTLTMAGSCAGIGILAWKVDDLETELRLLKDFTEGRISHLPYRPEEKEEP